MAGYRATGKYGPTRAAAAYRSNPSYSGAGIFAGKGLYQAGRQTRISNPRLTNRWQSSISPITGKSGFSGPLQNRLQRFGIEYGPRRTNNLPNGGFTPSSSLSRGRATNMNGALAERMFANSLRKQGYTVTTTKAGTSINRVNTIFGPRVVDVVGTRINTRNPELSQRVHIESKNGRAGLTQGPSGTIIESAKDASLGIQNRVVRGAGTALKYGGRALGPAAVAVDAYSIGRAYQADGNRVGYNTKVQTAKTAGGLAGAWAGVKAGAAAGGVGGAAFAGVGAVPGAIVGGIIGGIGGAIAGSWGAGKAAERTFTRPAASRVTAPRTTLRSNSLSLSSAKSITAPRTQSKSFWGSTKSLFGF